MRDNGVDSQFLFLHHGFSIVASLAHPDEIFKITKRSWMHLRENRVHSLYLFIHCVFSIVTSPAHP